MKKLKHELSLVLLLLTAFSGVINGAILYLKQTQKNDGSANSAKGLMLPRVLLTDLDKLSGGNAITGVDDDSQQDKDTYTGLTIYNNVGGCPGVYVWSGSEWEKLEQPCPPVKDYMEIGGMKWAKANIDAPGTFAKKEIDYGITIFPRLIGFAISHGRGQQLLSYK